MNGDEERDDEAGPRPIDEDDVRKVMLEITRPHRVKLDRNDTLTFPEDAPGYELDARPCGTAQGLLDTLWHLLHRRWFTREVLTDFIATMKGRAERMHAAWHQRQRRRRP